MKHSLDFKMILASSIHDMKNSLGLLNHQIEALMEAYRDTFPELMKSLAKIEYQASRVNNDLIQLLSLYKMGADIYPLRIEENDVLEFLDEQLLRHRPVAEHLGILLVLNAPAESLLYFDAALVAGVLNDVIINALKHARHQIQIRAYPEGRDWIIEVEDDGPGYPPALLEKDFKVAGESHFDSGSTGLGLYFAHEVAMLHQVGAHQGSIALDNQGPLRGGRFRILIPASS